MIGNTLAHYKIVEKIGAGGMGEVYRASDSRLGRDVALKILPEEFVQDPERMARFQREAQVLARLNHANIAAIYGLEQDGDTYGLALEIVEGPTLADRILSGPIRVSEALMIARQIAEAIEFAHESGIVHRDLKPANVKLTLQGDVKVLDFGLAKALADEPGLGTASSDSPTISPAMTSPVITGALTGANVILGTAAYMSPEQARGRPVDRRCDIWSFGVVLFEMLTGRSLFASETVSDTLASVLKTDPDWDALPSDVSPWIRRLLHRCLTRDPRQRLRDIGDARLVIEEVIEGREPAVAEAAGGTTLRRRVVERLVWLTAILVAFGLGRWSGSGGDDWRNASSDWSLSIVRSDEPGENSRIAISPDGSTVAFSDAAGLRLRRLDRLEPVLLDGTGSGDALPFWSPDGRALGFWADAKLKRVSLETGFVETVADMPNPRAPGVWLPGDRILFEPSYGDELMVVPAAGGVPPRPVTEVDPVLGIEAGHRWAAPLPDGNRFLFVESNYGPLTGAIRVGSLDSRESREILPRQTGEIHSLSVQGRYVLYVRDSIALAHPFDPKRAELTGDPVVLLGGAKVAALSVSEDGVLAWVPQRNEEEQRAVITWLDRGGKIVESLPELPDFCLSPRISQDGRFLVFDAHSSERGVESNLLVYDLKRALPRRIASGTSLIGNWSPDGTRIAFYGEGKLMLMKADGTGTPERLLPDSGDVQEVPSDWSSDGRYIAFTRVAEGGEQDIRIAEVGKGEASIYAQGDGAQCASFAPNGKWIAYESSASGKEEVYVDSFPTPGSPIQVTPRGGLQPRWRGDGRELFFARRKQQSDLVEFWAAAVQDTAGTPEFAPPILLFEAHVHAWNQFYDVSADGQRFVVPVSPRPSTRPIHVVADWRRTLERR